MKITIPAEIFTKQEAEHLFIVSLSVDSHVFKIEGKYQRLWLMIDGEKSRDGLLEEFAAELGLEAEEIREDVFKFLDELRDLKLLKEIEA